LLFLGADGITSKPLVSPRLADDVIWGVGLPLGAQRESALTPNPSPWGWAFVLMARHIPKRFGNTCKLAIERIFQKVLTREKNQ